MHIVVVGCGRVGSELAIELEGQGHSVAIIDKSKTSFRKLPPRWTGRAVLGYGFDREHLEQAGISEAGALAAVTRGDNTNIVSARVAKEHYGVANVVVRIYDPRRAVIFERLGIPTVASVRWATDQAMRRLFPEEKHTDWVDATGKLALVEYGVPEDIVGLHVDSLLTNAHIRLVGITRAGKAAIATEGQIVQEGDTLHLAVAPDIAAELKPRVANILRGQ